MRYWFLACILFISFGAHAQSVMFPGPGNSAVVGTPAATIAFTATTTATSATSPHTFTAFSIGTADASRYVAVAIRMYAASAGVSGVTIGGVTAAMLVDKTATNTDLSIWIAAVPTGTTGNVVVTMAGTADFLYLGGWAIYNLTGAGAATNTASTNTSGGTMTLASVPAGGIAIGAATTHSAATYTWTTLAKNWDIQPSDSLSGASQAYATLQTSLGLTATASSTTNFAAVAASLR